MAPPDPESIAFLDQLDTDEREELLQRGRKRQFRRGTSLFNEGERSDRVMVVLEGRVKVSYFTEEGKEVVLAIRGSGDILGDLSAIDGEPLSATVTALDNVDAQVVTADEFLSFLESHSKVGLVLLRMLSQRLREADLKRIEFGAYDTLGRVARRLVELADRFGERSDTGVRITLPLSQEELAGWTGSSREAVAKALQVFRTRGWIETARREITILDPAELGKRAT
jgi:CRP-like cAMP-binding protein